MPKAPRPIQESITVLLYPAEVDVLPDVIPRLPDVTVEVLPSETEDDRKLAVASYVLSAETSGVEDISTSAWEQQARDRLMSGSRAVRLVSSGEQAENEFWTELRAALRADKV